jgi:phosphoribosylformylglycinamidine cyclo-ligase
MALTYEQAGVSIDAGNELVRRIKKIVSKSKLSSSAIGGFSGLFPLSGKNKNTFLSGCCDGVGTKLKLAFLLDKHDTVGIDLVAMNVNDLICTGAKPLFFLDYFACGKLEVGIAEQVVRGIQKACEESDCALLGGETAEMPGFYPPGEYDLAGFAVGSVEKEDLIDRKAIKGGDILLGLPSSGVHSNGYSLVRKVFSERELKSPLGRELLTPTKLYVRPILKVLAQKGHGVKGIAHLTGGGWPENIPRVLPKGCRVEIRKGSWPILPVFEKIRAAGRIEESEMFRTFNMGIGLVLVVDKTKADKVRRALKTTYVLGEIRKGGEGVHLK